MNKAYRHVYKDGIGWVAIAENGSCVSSSKGSGTVSSKTKVEVLKNFFDLRNSVVLNNGFLLKGLFAATLFCGVFVGDLKAATEQQIADIQNNGTAVYTDNDGNRMEKVVNPNGSIGFKGKFDVSILDRAINGVVEIGGKYYLVPTGTLNKVMTPEKLKENPVLFEVVKDSSRPTGYRGLTFEELKNQGKKVGSTLGTGDRESVIYDEDTKRWYVGNQANGEKLYPAVWTSDSSRKIRYVKWSEIRTNKGEPIMDTVTGLYTTSGSGANEVDNLGIKPGDDIFSNSPERLSLVGKNSISTTPQKYTQADKTNGKIPDDRKVGENKDGTIRLGNVAKAELDDEAVNLGQLNQKLQNVKAKVPYVHINSSITGSGSNHDNDGAKGENAIAIGPNAKSGNSSVAIGLGAKTGEGVIDKNSYNKIETELNKVKQKYEKAKKLKNHEKMAEFGKRRDELEELLKTYSERYEYNGKLITQAEYKNLSADQQKEATIKYISNVMYENSVAIGYDAQALANDAVAIGNGAKVIVDGSKEIVAGGGVAIGQGSVSNAREDKDLKGYIPKASYKKFDNPAWIATNQPFAVGDDEKTTRQITGVAAGTKDTDAVNVAQLKQTGFYVEGDIGAKSRIQNEDEYDNGTLNIKTDDKWENNDVVYTGKNLETKIIPSNPATDPATKRPYATKIKIGMTDTPRFKSITIANDNAVKGLEDNSPIELKKFDDKTNNNTIGFAGENNSAIKLTNLADGTISEDSKDAITGSQLHATKESIQQNTSKITKKADKNAGNLETGDITAWKTKLGVSNIDTTINEFKNTGMFKVSDGKNKTDIKVNDTITFAASNDNLTVLNNAGTITYGLSKNLKDINSITTENKGILTINAGDNKQYTFGDTDLVDTSVITNKDLKEVVKQINTQVGSVNLNIAGDKSTKGSVNLKTETLNINGDGKNITTSVKNGEVKVSLNDEINLGKDGEIKTRLGNDGLTITQVDGTKGPSITADGIAMNDKQITGLKSGLDGLGQNGKDGTIADYKKLSDAKKEKYKHNAATIGDLATVDSEITNINANITNTTNIIGGNDNKLIHKDGTLTDEGKKALTTNAASGQDVVKNTNIIQAINNINKQGTRFFHVNDGTKPMGTKDGEDTEDSSAGSKGGVSIGIRAEVGQNAKNAIAIGTKSQALAENSIAIGYGNVVKGRNSGAIGDPSTVEADGSYSVGNDNTVYTGANGSFILGNHVTIEKNAKQALGLGENTKVSVEGGVALGARSVSSREIGKESGYDISTDSASTSKDATWLSTAGAVAVGDETQGITRQITGVAAGSQDTDAVNVAQLKAVQKISQSAQWISVNNENNLPKSQAGKGDVKGYTGNNSVAIGPGSTTKIGSTAEGKPLYRENTVSVGGVTKDKNGKNVLTQRTISNVAPGVLDSDAATMGQLRAGLNDVYGKLGEYKKDASAGTASALAVGNLPQATIPGKGMISLGSGFYDGQSAMAIGLSKMSDSGKWVFKGSASYDSQEKAGAALSVGFHF